MSELRDGDDTGGKAMDVAPATAAGITPLIDAGHTGLGWATCLLTLVTVGGLLAFVLVYTRLGAPFLDRLEANLGEELMRTGMRMEEVGALEEAREYYERALAGRFEGPQNRILTLKRLGALLWQDRQYEMCLPYLQEVANSAHAPTGIHELLFDALFNLRRFEEAQQVLRQWAAALDARQDTAVARADLKFQEGRLALAQGDTQTAEARFLEGVAASPGGRNASELARLYYAQGRFDDALEYIDQYLRGAASGPRADDDRRLRARIVEHLKP